MDKIPYDKKLHFGAGLLIAILAGFAYVPAFGLWLAVAAGVMKEIRDWCIYKAPDWKDMVCTWAGGLVGWVLLGVVM